MTHEKPNYPVTFHFSASLDDLERLVRCIDKTSITELVKHDKHLQQHVFHGFRPTHLPWDRVPNAVARHAQECSGTMDYLLKVWHTTNSSLKKQVKEEVHVDTIEDDIAKILANLDHDKEKRDRLLWALLLDDRGEIQAALTSGLRDALMNDSSTLMIKADRHKLAAELEKARQEINSLKNERDNLKEQNQKIAALKNEIATLTGAKAQMEAHFQEELTQRDAALQETKCERDTAQKERDTVYQEKDTLQAALEQEQCRNSELKRSVDDLKTSLDAAIASQHENAGDVKRRLDETLKLLEKERAENTRLRLSINKAERERDIAYEKRDEERARRQKLEARIERLEHDKNVLITQKRDVHKQLEQVRTDLSNAHHALAAKENQIKVLVDVKQVATELHAPRQAHEENENTPQIQQAFPQLDEAWEKAVHVLSGHLSSGLYIQRTVDNPIQPRERWNDWQSWQQIESTLVQPLLAMPIPTRYSLDNAEQAQKLLILRWYLLEWVKLSIHERSLTGSSFHDQVKLEGEG